MQNKWLRGYSSLKGDLSEWLCAAESGTQVQKLILTRHKMIYPHAPVIRDSRIPRSQCGDFIKRHSSEISYCAISARMSRWQGLKLSIYLRLKGNTTK